MSFKEKNKLYRHLSDLIIEKKIFTKVDRIFHIKDIKKALKATEKYKRGGKILVTTSNNI